MVLVFFSLEEFPGLTREGSCGLGGRLSEEFPDLRMVSRGWQGGGVLRELSRDGLPWIGGSRSSSQILVAKGPPSRGGVLRAIPKRWWK